jgi:hypothetical protein
VGLLNEVLQHFFGDAEVGDDAILKRPNGSNVPGRAAQHIFRVYTDGFEHFAPSPRFLADGYHRWFVKHNSTTPNVNQGVGRT